MQISDLNTIAPGIPKIASKIRMHLQAVFLGDFFPNFPHLSVIPDHDAEMFSAIRLKRLHFEDCQKLMLTHFAPGCAFASSQHFQIEDIRIKLHGFLRIVNFDHHMIDPIDLYRHFGFSFPLWEC